MLTSLVHGQGRVLYIWLVSACPHPRLSVGGPGPWWRKPGLRPAALAPPGENAASQAPAEPAFPLHPAVSGETSHLGWVVREASGAVGRDGHRGIALLTQQVLCGEGRASPGTGRPVGAEV